MLNMSVGRQDFKKMVDQDNSPYVDKTHLIEDVLSEDVLLYTRPRRFGKSLNMSMLYYFFSNKENSQELFKGLRISSNNEAMKHLNKYPVINLTFGTIENRNLNEQIYSLGMTISDFIENHGELRTSEYLSDYQKERIHRLETNTYDDNELKESLFFLSKCLYFHYQKKVIILIDEYDIPLNHARNKGYYDEFYDFYSVFLSKGLKYNNYLEKGVLTGCLKIVKDSMFSGLNNIISRDLLELRASDCFGFTQDEVDELLRKANLLEKREIIRDWYDGYTFSNKKLYNPWSVCEYIDILQHDKDVKPKAYWLGTSTNKLIYDYIKNMSEALKQDFRRLVDGESISRRINPILTYRDLDEDAYNPCNIYSFLLFSGYLKIKSPAFDQFGNELRNTYNLVIPNKEVLEIYEDSFTKWFDETYIDYDLKFIDALLNKHVKEANNILNASLFETLSYFDNNESFYHSYISKLLKTDGYTVESNRESGLGRYDLFVHKLGAQPALLIECKYSKSRNDLKETAYEGVNQMINKKYIEGLNALGYENVIAYCISFYKKECYIEIVES